MSLSFAATIDLPGFVVEAEFEVERGETVALVGPNGAGKSTVLRAIAGLQQVASGSISLDGKVWDDSDEDIFVAPHERDVGLVFQQYELFDHMSVAENVAFGLRAAGRDRSSASRSVDTILGRLGITDVAEQKPPTLSGGQAQRVALSRALVTEPSVLLLDEPLAALDVSARGAVRHDLQHWIDVPNACRLIVTHDPVDAHALADRVVVLERGRVVQRGTLAQLAAAPRSSYVADLMGTNLLEGRLIDGMFYARGGAELAVGAHDAPDGEAVATIRPAAVALHREHPEGSPRNVWATVVATVERSGDRVRVGLAEPSDMVVEVTEAGLAALDVREGDRVWASVKASEISVVPDA